jgi:superfamily II DNA/RNA helicase
MKFTDFGLLPSLERTLKEKLFFKPTEIQTQTIPLMMSGQSVVGISETGSGKTLAYALPLLHMLKTLENQGDPVKAESAPRAIVMVPTRELGEQVSKVFKTLTHDTRLRVRPALGGMDLAQARRNTSGAFEILLATPGRLVQMIQRDLIDLSDVRRIIFDEADQMMDQGFLPDSTLVVETCPKDTQLAMFSATVSTKVQELINGLFAKAEFIRSAGSGKTVSSLVTKNVTVVDGKRWPFFEKVLKQPVEGGTIIFTNTREQCDSLAKELTEKGYDCAIYRGEMDKNDRRLNLKKFRDGKVDLLISTDLAGRGLDLSNVARVINYHLPKQMENYLHRVGRTARAGREGLVVNLVTERDERLLAQLNIGYRSPLAAKAAADARAASKKAPVGRHAVKTAKNAQKSGKAAKPAAKTGTAKALPGRFKRKERENPRSRSR